MTFEHIPVSSQPNMSFATRSDASDAHNMLPLPLAANMQGTLPKKGEGPNLHALKRMGVLLPTGEPEEQPPGRAVPECHLPG